MIPWTIAPQTPLSIGISRQEYCSGLAIPSPGGLPNPGVEPRSLALLAGSLLSEPPGKPITFNTFQMPLGWVCSSFNFTDEGLAYKLYFDIHLSWHPHILCRLDNGTVLEWNWYTLPWSIERIGNYLSCFAEEEEEEIFIYCTASTVPQVSAFYETEHSNFSTCCLLPSQRCLSFSNNVYVTHHLLYHFKIWTKELLGQFSCPCLLIILSNLVWKRDNWK